MFVAEWSFDMKYGTREETLRLVKELSGTMKSFWKAKRTRTLVGSIGAPESRLVLAHEFASLADLEASWAALHQHGEVFRKIVGQMKNVIVDGSPRWEIYRVVDEA